MSHISKLKTNIVKHVQNPWLEMSFMQTQLANLGVHHQRLSIVNGHLRSGSLYAHSKAEEIFNVLRSHARPNDL